MRSIAPVSPARDFPVRAICSILRRLVKLHKPRKGPVIEQSPKEWSWSKRSNIAAATSIRVINADRDA